MEEPKARRSDRASPRLLVARLVVRGWRVAFLASINVTVACSAGDTQCSNDGVTIVTEEMISDRVAIIGPGISYLAL